MPCAMALPKVIRRPRRRWLVVAFLVIAGGLVWAQNSLVLIESYAVVNQRTIVVSVGVAPCSWTRVTGVVETAAEVRVGVETLPCPLPLPGTAQLDIRELPVALAADLGTRIVEDAAGRAVPLR